MGHWYSKEGEPHHDADLRIARKMGYLPSVTSILKIMAQPGLDIWKNEQILLSALTTPQIEGEMEMEFIQRVMAGADEQRDVAATFGERIHEAIENYIPADLQYRRIPPFVTQEINLDLAFSGIRKFLDDAIVKTVFCEKIFVSSRGYGGKLDWYGDILIVSQDTTDDRIVRGLIDWKTQGVKQRAYKKPKNVPFETVKEIGGVPHYIRPNPAYYDEMPLQLAGNKMLLEENGHEVDVCISVIISSNPESLGFIDVKIYDNEKIEWAKETFLSILHTWKLKKKYQSQG